ncbi:MAG: TonB-dependent receptor [Puia sp.]|nr:TonB-dependent receptor [Puia sp.]
MIRRKHIYRGLILVLHCIRFAPATAQQLVSGYITDTSHQVLAGATVTLWRLPDSGLVTRIACKKNEFTLRIPGPGHFLLSVSFVGYATVSRAFSATGSPPHLDLGRFMLVKTGKRLRDVVVEGAGPPVKMKNDTLVYNAGAYPVPPNATVEDLLKKLPGISVDPQGNITFQGRPVRKIFIDGRDFFLNDPRLASQNLTADMVQSVEAFDASSYQSRLTGIKDIDPDKALNLVIKEKKKRSLTGKVYAGMGGQGGQAGYSAGGNDFLMLGDDRMQFAVLNANNINGLYNGTDHSGQGGGFVMVGKSVISLNGALPSGAGKSRTITGSANFGIKLSPKWDLVVNYSGNQSHQSTNHRSDSQTFLGDSTLLQNDSGNSTTYYSNQLLSAKTTWTPGKSDEIVIRPEIAFSKGGANQLDSATTTAQKTVLSYLLNKTLTQNGDTSHETSLKTNITWGHRFAKDRRILAASFDQSFSRTAARDGLQTQTKAFDSTGSPALDQLVNQVSDPVKTTQLYQGNIDYTEPVGHRNSINIGYNGSLSNSHADKNSFDWDPLSGKYDLADTLTSSHFSYSTIVHHLEGGYNKTGGRFRYQVGMGMDFTKLKNLNRSNDSALIQHFYNWSPRLFLGYTLSREKSVSFEYKAKNTNPSIDQLQPVPDLSNPQLIHIGNPALKQQFDQNGSIAFSSLGDKSFTTLLLRVAGNYSANHIAPSNITLSSGIQEIQYVNINGIWGLNTNLSYGLPIGHTKHGNLKFSTTLNYNKDKSFTNGVEDTRRSFSGSQTLGLSYNIGQKAYTDANAGIGYTASSYSIQQAGTTLLTQTYDLSERYQLPLGLTLSAKYHLQVTGKQDGLPGSTVGNLDATIFRTLLKDRRGELQLSCYNLFDNKTSVSAVSGPNSISTQTAGRIGRLVLLSFVYRFNKVFGQAGPEKT